MKHIKKFDESLFSSMSKNTSTNIMQEFVVNNKFDVDAFKNSYFYKIASSVTSPEAVQQKIDNYINLYP